MEIYIFLTLYNIQILYNLLYMCTAFLISNLQVKGIENTIRYTRMLGNEENHAKRSSMLKEL